NRLSTLRPRACRAPGSREVGPPLTAAPPRVMIQGARARPGVVDRSSNRIPQRTKTEPGDQVSMRLWHLFVVILCLGLILAIVRDRVGRIALIVFVTALGEVIIGTTAVLALFQTISALGEAKGVVAHAEAVATTTLVLLIATAVMSLWLFAGAWLVQASLP